MLRGRMDENIEINKTMKNKKQQINIWGLYISICFILIGILWYAVNIGIIPLSFIQEQAGPIIIIIIGLLILIKSLKR
jgi:hypothetical protein